MKKNRMIAAVIVLVLFGFATAGFTYLTMEVYKPEEGIEQQIRNDGARKKDMVAYGDDLSASVGIIIYPDGKVNHLAYGLLAKQISEECGCLCVVPKVTTGLATLDFKAARKIMETYDTVETWYIGGHGVGAIGAARYAAKSPELFRGVILLAGYAKDDISAQRALSIYGDCDAYLDMNEYSAKLANLPADYTEVVIEGGNHEQFGNYGEHIKDGEAGIDSDEQQKQTAEAIAAFIAS